MTKYRIIDPDIEKAVRGLFVSDEAFDRNLQNSCRMDFKYRKGYDYVVVMAENCEDTVGECYIEVNVYKDYIEELKDEYNPKAWNCLALVKPPKINEPYRVIYENFRYLGWWDGYCFEFPQGSNSNKLNPAKVLFKPWDDEE